MPNKEFKADVIFAGKVEPSVKESFDKFHEQLKERPGRLRGPVNAARRPGRQPDPEHHRARNRQIAGAALPALYPGALKSATVIYLDERGASR